MFWVARDVGGTGLYAFILTGIYLVLVVVITAASYHLGRSKTENPRMAALIGFLLGLFPPFGLIYLVVLALKEDSGIV